MDVEVGVPGDRRDPAGREVAAVEVRDPVLAAVGGEVHRLADPHRVGVLAHVVGQRLEPLRREVVEPDVGVLAALVPLPVVLLVAAPVVDHPAAVGGEGGEDAAFERQAFGIAALARHREELDDRPEGVLVAGAVDDPLAVGAPRHRLHAHPGPGEPARLPPCDRERVDRRGAVVLAVKATVCPSGEIFAAYSRPGWLVSRWAQPVEVVFRILPGEDDHLPADVGVLHEPGLDAEGGRRAPGQDDERCQRPDQMSHRVPPGRRGYAPLPGRAGRPQPARLRPRTSGVFSPREELRCPNRPPLSPICGSTVPVSTTLREGGDAGSLPVSRSSPWRCSWPSSSARARCR